MDLKYQCNMKPSRKTIKIWAAFIFGFTMFINGMMAVFVFWIGRVPENTWFVGFFLMAGTAAALATFVTYLVMINPDWWRQYEELESERIEVRNKLAELSKFKVVELQKLCGFQHWLGSNYSTLPTDSIEMTDRAIKYVKSEKVSN